MNTSKDNVQTMIAAFIAFDQNTNKGEQESDDLLRLLLDNSKLPTIQGSKARVDRTPEQVTEGEQMESLLNAAHAQHTIWETPEDLYNLIVTYPPVILEQLLITAIVIRILRHDEIDMNSETDAFNEFFDGWKSVVVYC
ncbi:MAG: hypothetical protein KAJ19_29610 [Gammaproteobacteria bacterium]|nr:hypothetical protein [Gammaproteobacteria bacterium]